MIVAFGNQIAMEETLELSLQRIFGVGQAQRQAVAAGAPDPVKDDRDLPRRAWEHYSRSQEYLRQGNWTGYGEEQRKLEALLREMQQTR